MKKLLTLLSFVMITSSATSTIIACNSNVYFNNGANTGGNTNSGGDNNTGDTDETDETDEYDRLLTANTIISQIPKIVGLESVEKVNDVLEQTLTEKNIRGVASLYAVLVQDNLTDVDVFITTKPDFAMYKGQEIFKIKNAILDSKNVSTYQIREAFKALQNLKSEQELLDMLELITPKGVKITPTADKTIPTDYYFLIEPLEGWTIDGRTAKTGFSLKNVLSTEAINSGLVVLVNNYKQMESELFEKPQDAIDTITDKIKTDPDSQKVLWDNAAASDENQLLVRQMIASGNINAMYVYVYYNVSTKQNDGSYSWDKTIAVVTFAFWKR